MAHRKKGANAQEWLIEECLQWLTQKWSQLLTQEWEALLLTCCVRMLDTDNAIYCLESGCTGKYIPLLHIVQFEGTTFL